MGNKIMKTIDEYFKEYSYLYQFEEGPSEYLIDKEDFKLAMIEFAKLHVKAALEAASNKASILSDGEDIGSSFTWEAYNTSRGDIEYEINKDSILNCYPDTLIK